MLQDPFYDAEEEEEAEGTGAATQQSVDELRAQNIELMEAVRALGVRLDAATGDHTDGGARARTRVDEA